MDLANATSVKEEKAETKSRIVTERGLMSLGISYRLIPPRYSTSIVHLHA